MSCCVISSLSDFGAPSGRRVRYTAWINPDGRPMAGVLLPMRRSHPMDRDTDLLLPLSLQDWLSKGHLARDVVEVVEDLDLSVLVQAYGGTRSTPYHPAMLLALLIDGYATGRFSSRKIKRATYDSLAFRFIACGLDHKFAQGRPAHAGWRAQDHVLQGSSDVEIELRWSEL